VLAGRRIADVLQLVILLQRLINHPELLQPRPVLSSLYVDPVQYRTMPGLDKVVFHDVWMVSNQWNIFFYADACYQVPSFDLVYAVTY
jgi:hypothetical protein